MTRSAAEALGLVLDAVNRRDAEALVDLMHPEVEFLPISAALEGPAYAGRAGVRRWLRSLELDWKVFEARLDRVCDFGTCALGLGGWHAVGRASGVELDAQGGAWVARIRDERVVRWRAYTDGREALESGELADEADCWSDEPAPFTCESAPVEVAAAV
ncbi:MAG TPA: nuclear transport factor 2 family protein [Thermoleophilaceae bacterium]|nr:nuclear transport factor 2 family protein [Thermoleophilaceae bacterium]